MFTGYGDSKISSKSMSSEPVKNTSETSLEYAKQLLSSAKVINGALSTISNNAVEELNTLKAMLSGDIEDAKWRSGGVMKNGGWHALGLLAVWGTSKVIADGMATGGSRFTKPVIKAVKSLAGKIGYNKSAVVVGAGIGATAGITANILSKKSYEELDAEERLRVLRARIELTTKYSKDAIHGLNSLVNEMVDVANTIIKAHGAKQEAKTE